MKITGVLIYPFSNKLVVKVTRQPDGYDSYPRKERMYEISYTSVHLESFLFWLSKLEALNLKKIIITRRGY